MPCVLRGGGSPRPRYAEGEGSGERESRERRASRVVLHHVATCNRRDWNQFGSFRRPPQLHTASFDEDRNGRQGIVGARRRAAINGYLNVPFVELFELLDAVARRERAEREGRPIDSYLPVLERLGVSAAQREETVQVTSRRFARELAVMEQMAEEARRRDRVAAGPRGA